MITVDFLEWETDMKFDVIVGNPPYQNTSAKKEKLWLDFLKKALELSNNVVAFVTPDVWVDGQSKVAKISRQVIANNSLVYLNLDATSYFSVGESIC